MQGSTGTAARIPNIPECGREKFGAFDKMMWGKRRSRTKGVPIHSILPKQKKGQAKREWIY